MPHIVIHGLNSIDFGETEIALIESNLSGAIVLIEELQLKEGCISYSFPLDPTIMSDDVPVVIFVECLFDKPERTTEVRKKLAEDIGRMFRSTAEAWRKVGEVVVFVKRFDPEKDGFYRSV